MRPNLTAVTYPDGKSRSYLYENRSFFHALTAIIEGLSAVKLPQEISRVVDL